MAVFLACRPGLYTSHVRTEPASGARRLPSFRAGCCLILWGPVPRHAPPSCQPVSVRALLQLSVGSGVRARVSGALWAPSPTRSRFAATTRPPSHASLSLACANGPRPPCGGVARPPVRRLLGMAFLPTFLQGSLGIEGVLCRPYLESRRVAVSLWPLPPSSHCPPPQGMLVMFHWGPLYFR